MTFSWIPHNRVILAPRAPRRIAARQSTQSSPSRAGRTPGHPLRDRFLAPPRTVVFMRKCLPTHRAHLNAGPSITLLRGIHKNVIEFSPATVAEADPP